MLAILAVTKLIPQKKDEIGDAVVVLVYSRSVHILTLCLKKKIGVECLIVHPF